MECLCPNTQYQITGHGYGHPVQSHRASSAPGSSARLQGRRIILWKGSYCPSSSRSSPVCSWTQLPRGGRRPGSIADGPAKAGHPPALVPESPHGSISRPSPPSPGFCLGNTFSSKHCTARFHKLELRDSGISLVTAAVTEYKCVSFPESSSGTSAGAFLLVYLLIYSPSPLLFMLFAQQNRVLLNRIILYAIMCYNKQSAQKSIFALKDHFQIV